MIRNRLSAERRAVRRWTALITAGALVALGTTVFTSPAAVAAGAPGISTAKTAPGSVLAGEAIPFTLSATNPSSNADAAPEYNASFRDVLPLGVTYTAGSTKPADIGEPAVITDAGTGRQTLIWSDAFDLQVGATSQLSFTGTVDPSVLPVGSTVNNTGQAYASTSPRYVPKFSATGVPVANASVQSATSAPTATSITALSITKAEPSPEAKLLRGVHDHPTVYTLTVTNTGQAATNAVTVTDYLPAEEEFLGCGQVDNSAAVEYPGAPPLTATPAVGANCPTPISVDTVANPPADGTVSYPAGVYTKVVWNLGVLAAGQTLTFSYAAGIPLRANVLFAGGPSAASLGQTANLDNNTGPSTRQVGDAASQTNYVHAVGTYTGPVAAGTNGAVFADTSHVVTVNDLRIYKSVTPDQFAAGQLSHYTLHVDSSEYVDNSAITITDVLPNGVCPLDDVRNYTTGAPAECASGAGFAPSLPYQSVTQNADGTFTVVFSTIAVAKDGSTTITYTARDRTNYTGGSLAGVPPAAGDAFTNHASETGTSTPVAATGFTGTQTVHDTTSATQTSTVGQIAKTVAARAAPMNCSTGTYGSTNPVFAKGDRVCFQISAPFATANQTRNAVLSDFLPDNTTYETGSVSYPAANTVDPSQISFDSSAAATGQLQWALGAAQADGSTVIPAGAVFVVQFSVIITDAAAGPAPDKPGNIAKLRTESSDGVATSLRAEADFRIAAAPPVGITKGVASVNGSTPVNPANTDHVAVREGDSVVFRVDATNNGSAANANDLPVGNLVTWDVLPAGITCAQVSAISDGGVCTDPGDAGQPSFAGNGTDSALVWNTAAPLAAGATKTYNYTVTIPAGVSVSTDLVNTSAVRSYDVINDVSGASTYFPAANIDTTVPVGSYDAPAAADTSDVYLRNVGVTKRVVSAINEAGNVGAEGAPASTTQATPGETVTFTTTATVPAGSTVFDGTFTDPLPSGLTLNSATVTYRPDSGSATTGALPAGVTFSAAAPPTVTFPATYDNTTATDQVFTMTIVATLVHQSGDPLTRNNTSSFTSQTAASGGTAVPTRTASATVTDVEPLPTVTKTNNAGGPVSGGQTITYTVKPTNAAGRPPLHDAWQLDCLPIGLTFGAYGTLPSGVTTSAPVAGNGSNGCSTGFTALAWNLGDLAGGTTLTLTYTATVDPGASGRSSFTNGAIVSGNSLAGARTAPTDLGNPAGRAYGSSATSTVNIAGATALKSVTPGSAAVGDTVTYRTSAVLPVGVQFYNLSLIDQVPNGIDPNSIVEGPVTCSNADATACSLNSATPLTPVAGPASTTVIGWLLGDAASATQVRTVTVQYTAKVKDTAAAAAGVGLVNQLHVAWNTAAGTPPTSAGATFNQTSPTVTATVTVLEPSLSIAKSVSNSSPEPGDSFGYTLAVTNTNTTSTSAAYNVTVTDAVPTGVLVDPASISGGGTISGQTATGGGTIAWTVAGPVAKNAGITVTYSARLAPSGGLGTSGLTNTARVTGYDSLAGGGRHYTGGSATATVAPRFPKLTTTKSTPSGTTATVGSSFVWQVTVKNTGAGAAYQVGAVDTLPANWTYDAGSAQVTVNGDPPLQVEPSATTSGGVQTLTWPGLGNLPAGTSLVIVYTATPTAAVAGTPGVGLSVDQTNTASASAQDATGASGNSAGTYGSTPGSATAHIASADLSLAKAVGVAPVAGQGGSWTLAVHSNGPDTASGPFVVTEPFSSDGVTNVVASGTGWTCGGGAPITCTRGGTLASGANLPVITVSYDLDAGTAGTLTNTASVGAATFDPITSNNSASASTDIDTEADLAISKTLSSSSLIAGAPASYALAVSNLGPSAAAGPITVNDPLPAGTTFVSATGTGWTCNTIPVGTVAPTLTCTLPGPFAVGATPAPVIVTVGIPSSRTAAVTNTASVSSPTPDPVPANNTDSVTNTPVTQADLSLQKQHLTATFVAGQTADYRISVHSAGESDAAGVTVADDLPAGLSYHGFSSADPAWSCSAAGAAVTCTYAGTFPAGADSSFVLTVDLATNFTGPAVNTASVSSTTTDPVPANNSDQDNSGVTTSADLSIVKTDSGTATAGGALTYQLAVHNAGPSDVAGAVAVTDALPAGLTFVSTDTGSDCTYADATRVLTCGVPAGLAAGADATPITVHTTVNSNVGPSTITNVAGVTSDTTDPDLSNNSSTDPVPVVTHADLSLTKVLTSATPVLAGTDAKFTLVASNAGPSDAAGVNVTDTLGDNLSFDSFTGAGWNCSATGQIVVCSRDTIVAGTSAPAIVLTARVSASTPVTLPAGTATLTNTAAIDSGTPGTDSNPAPVDVPVQAKADLTLVKTPKDAGTDAGRSFTWNLAVGNSGPSDAAGPITVVDTLPDHETLLSATGTGWDCTGTSTVTCVRADGLADGEQAPAIAVRVQIDPAAPVGLETNRATASSPTPGATATDSADLGVDREADMHVTKTHTGPVAIGSDLAFTIVVSNGGPSVADQLHLVDGLPLGLTFVSHEGSGWTCYTELECRYDGVLAPGEQAPPLTFVAKVGALAYPTVTNEAQLSSADFDLESVVADGFDVVVVPPSARLVLTKKHVGNFTVGKTGSYRLTVHNNGPTESPGSTVVTDNLPAGLTYHSVSGAGWSCAAQGQQVTCTHAGSLAAHGTISATLLVDVAASAYPTVVNSATATGPGSPASTATDVAPVTPTVVLGLTKKLVSYADDVATYDITVTDRGPNATVAPLTVTDPLPDGLTYRSASGPGWTCTASGNTVQCVRPAPLAVGESSTITVAALVSATPGTTVANIASVTGGGMASGGVTVLPSNSAILGVTATGNGAAGGGAAGGGGQLAQTGRDNRDPLVFAALMLLLGSGLLLLGRRRRA